MWWKRKRLPPEPAFEVGQGAPLDRLQRWLVHSGVETAPASRDAIEALERRYDIHLPDDFRDYLLAGVPVAENIDNVVTNWWRLHRITGTSAECPECPRGHLIFADYMMWCWAWAVDCSDGPKRGQIMLLADPDKRVAGSFTEFVDKYLTDHLSVCS